MQQNLMMEPSLLDYQLPSGQTALPCRLLVVADLGYSGELPKEPHHLDSINTWLARYQPRVECSLASVGRLSFTFRQLHDLHPEPLYRQLCAQLDQQPYYKKEAETTSSHSTAEDFADLNRQQEQLALLAQVYRHPRIRRLEATWLSLERLAEQARNSKTTEVYLLAITPEQLHEDLDQDLASSRVFDLAYTQELGQYGGQPFSMLLVDNYWKPQHQELHSLQQLALLGQIALCPVITGIDPSFLGMQAFTDELSQETFEALASSRRFTKVRDLMASEAARYLTFVLPRVLLRPPYQLQLDTSWFQEASLDSDLESLAWGNPAYPLASQLLHSFQQLGAYTGSLQAQGKLAPGFSGVQLGNAWVKQPPLEVSWLPDQINQLVHQGFSPWQPGGEKGEQIMLDRAVSAHAGSHFDASHLQPDDQLIFLLTSCRVAHYLKQLLRELLGTSASLEALETSLNKWLQGIVSAQERPVPEVMHRKPFRQARVELLRSTGEALTEARMHLQLTPHLRYQGESFTLSLSSPLVGGMHV